MWPIENGFEVNKSKRKNRSIAQRHIFKKNFNKCRNMIASRTPDSANVPMWKIIKFSVENSLLKHLDINSKSLKAYNKYTRKKSIASVYSTVLFI